MSTLSLESSNPTFGAAERYAAQADLRHGRATMQGVANKTAFLVGLTALAGALSYGLLPLAGSVLLISCLASVVIGIGVAFVLAGNPALSRTLAPVYAGVEGVFLGLFTKFLDATLLAQGIAPAGGSLALPALIITLSCVVAMLILYKTGLLRPTERFRAIVSVLTLGVMLAYLANFILVIAFGTSLPYLSLSSAFQGGQAAMIGLGLNAAILVLASLWLVIDFGLVEGIVEGGAPEEMEWFGAFSLLVTLAWIYYEAVKLAFRLALIMGRSND